MSRKSVQVYAGDGIKPADDVTVHLWEALDYELQPVDTFRGGTVTASLRLTEPTLETAKDLAEMKELIEDHHEVVIVFGLKKTNERPSTHMGEAVVHKIEYATPNDRGRDIITVLLS